MTDREIARKINIAWAINTKKDFCKVGKDIIPFDIVCDLSKATSYSKNVTANGKPVLSIDHVIPGMVGNAGMGIESGVSGLAGTVVLTNGSPTVTANGKGSVRNGDVCKMNCDAAGKSNVPGKIYTSTIQAQASRIEQNMWFSAREGLDGETDRRYGPNYDRYKHIADEWNSGKPLGEQIKRVVHANMYTIPDEVIAARQAVVDEANAKWATIDALRSSPMAAVFYAGGTVAGAEPETLDKLAQTGQVVGGIVGPMAAARGGVNPIRPPMQGERPLTQQAVRLPEPTQRPGIRPPVAQANGVIVRTSPPEAGSIRNVNPGYPNAPGRTQNCVNCSQATDSTLSGNPASALPSRGPVGIDALENHYGGRFSNAMSSSAIQEQMLGAGNGARGIVFGARGPGEVGHVFNVVNQNGVVRFLDGQVGGPASLNGYTNFHLLRTTNP